MKKKLFIIGVTIVVILLSIILIIELRAICSQSSYSPEITYLPSGHMKSNDKSSVEIPKNCKIQVTFITTPEEFQKYFNSLVNNDTIDQLVITAEPIRNDTIRWTVYKTHL
jgi:hypothetical protein